MGHVIYLSLKQSVKTSVENVKILDVASVYTKDANLMQKIKNLSIYRFHDDQKMIVISSLYIISMIEKAFLDVTVEFSGADQVVVSMMPSKKKNGFMTRIRVMLLSVFAFLGSAFSVVTYNNDTGLRQILLDLHEMFMLEPAKGRVSVGMVSYAIGIAFGVMLFFHHAGVKKKEKEPTPLEVQMRLYEEDIEASMIMEAEREKEIVDVN